MDLDRWLLIASFITALVPSVILLALYGFRTRFWSSETGWAFFWLIVVVVASYGLSLVSLIFGEWANSDGGMWVRALSRFGIAAVLWNLLRVFLRAQRRGTLAHERDRVYTKEEP